MNNKNLAIAGAGIGAIGAFLYFRKPGVKTFTVAVECGPNGRTVPTPGKYDAWANVYFNVAAYPDSGYKFDRWFGDVPAGTERDQGLSLLVSDNISVKATFVENLSPVKYSVTFKASTGGTVYPEGTHQYDENSYVTIKATPLTGYKFVGWSGDWFSLNNPESIQVVRDKMEIVGNFTKTQESGVQLQTGWNTNIPYDGTPGAPEMVFASVVAYTTREKPIWSYNPERSPQWQFWHPSEPGSDMKWVARGDAVSIYVSMPCFWSWP